MSFGSVSVRIGGGGGVGRKASEHVSFGSVSVRMGGGWGRDDLHRCGCERVCVCVCMHPPAHAPLCVCVCMCVCHCLHCKNEIVTLTFIHS